uniref:CCHC-type domain-containing protein n=1 Tax=Chrysemys picta bellii TaxID=8478 RepID=A0A8C3IB59_CHRPI
MSVKVFWSHSRSPARRCPEDSPGDRGGHGPQSARARRPVVKACYACGQAGHLKRDCPDGAGGRGPHSAMRRCPIPQVGRAGREPQRLNACWACGRRGHLKRECPGPRNTAQGNPGRVGPVKDKRKIPRPRAAQRRDACWSCREPGIIRRHCPLRRSEERPEEVPVRPEGPKLL